MNTQAPLTAEAVFPVEPSQPTSATAVSGSAFAGLLRAMRGRWGLWVGTSVLLSSALATAGYLTGTQTYESRAILRIYPKESSILYKSADDSVLKTYQSYVKAETSFVASHGVMARAAENLRKDFPVITAEMTVDDLTKSVSVRRSESLIVLNTKSRRADFAAAKLTAVTNAYLELTAETKRRQSDLRLTELTTREADLFQRLQAIDTRLLEVGGEYGADAMMKAHLEKIAQINGLANRVADLENTLAAMRAEAGTASADMNDEHILRATLLDRGIADLNIEMARADAELAQLLERFADRAYQVRQKRTEIEVLEAAMASRRTQIQVLGQTGALTDQSDASDEESIAALEEVLANVTTSLNATRAEARDLNARRIEMAFLTEERAQVRQMLDDTRQALDIIRVESRNAMPGHTELMSPAVRPSEPSEDSAKMQAAGGLVAGAVLATALIMGGAISGRRVRWSDDLSEGPVPCFGALPTKPSSAIYETRRVDRIRNKIMLAPAREERLDMGRIISVARPAPGSPWQLSKHLAESFTRARLRVLLIDADLIHDDLSRNLDQAAAAGWLDHLSGNDTDPVQVDGLTMIPSGSVGEASDASLSPIATRTALALFAARYDAVIVNAGSLEDSVGAELLLSASDFAVADVAHGDLSSTLSRLEAFDRRPRNGGAVIFRDAPPKDPGLRA